MYYPTYVKVQLPLRKLPCCSIRKVISEDDPDYEAFQYLRSAIAALGRALDTRLDDPFDGGCIMNDEDLRDFHNNSLDMKRHLENSGYDLD